MKTIKDIYNFFKEEIKGILSTSDLNTERDFEIFTPNNYEHGQLTTNAALKLASSVNMSPQELGNMIIDNLPKEKLGLTKAELANPPFINFYLDDNWVTDIGDMVTNIGIDILGEYKHSITNLLQNNKDGQSSYINTLNDILKSKGSTMDPIFHATYPHDRANNIIAILKKEGYHMTNDINNMSFNIPEGKELAFKILELEMVVRDTIKHKSPYKLISYFYDYCSLFYRYNSKLLFRSMDKKEIMGNMYILNVVKDFTGNIDRLLNEYY